MVVDSAEVCARCTWPSCLEDLVQQHCDVLIVHRVYCCSYDVCVCRCQRAVDVYQTATLLCYRLWHIVSAAVTCMLSNPGNTSSTSSTQQRHTPRHSRRMMSGQLFHLCMHGHHPLTQRGKSTTTLSATTLHRSLTKMVYAGGSIMVLPRCSKLLVSLLIFFKGHSTLTATSYFK